MQPHAIDHPSIVACIEHSGVFRKLAGESRERLLTEAFVAYADRGEVIWFAGSESRFSATLASGYVKLVRTAAQGTAVTVDIAGPGHTIGLLAVIEGHSYPLTAIAVSPTWYLKVPAGLMRDLYNSDGLLRDEVLHTMAPRLRRAHDMMARLTLGKVEQRLASVVLLLADSFGVRHETGTTVAVPLTRSDLAEMAGTTVETTIRVLSRWSKQGWVEMRRRHLTVLQPEALLDRNESD